MATKSVIPLLGVLVFVLGMAAVRGQTSQCAQTCQNTVGAYLQTLYNRNITGACTFLAPNYALTFHADPNLVPYAGAYVGCAGLQTYINNVFAVVADISINTAYAPATYGLRNTGSSCGAVVVQFQENIIVGATGNAISQGTNTAVYTLNTAVNPPILLSCDIYVDGGQFAAGYCPGQIACYSAGASAGSSASASDLRPATGLSALAFIFSLTSAIVSIFSCLRLSK